MKNTEKLPLHTKNKADENFAKLSALFPNAVTETINEYGEVVRAIDKDILSQEIATSVVDGREERYQFTWPDKKKAILTANAPINKTLRPCKEESVNFDTTENLYIEGDNLEVLKLLQETYLGKVKMIYIDPPYNTGNDFVYNDEFVVDSGEWLEMSGDYDDDGNRLVKNLDSNGRFHTDWLNMMYPRLKLARDLLTDDGVIFISIDDNEVENLKKICNEIFGESNFVAEFIWKKKKGGGNDSIHIAVEHEYILLYAKNRVQLPSLFHSFSDDYLSRYKEEDSRGKYFWDTFKRKSGKQYYPITCPDGTILKHDEFGNDISWLRSEARFKEDLKTGEVQIIKIKDNWSVQFKQRIPEGKKPRSMLSDYGTTSDGSAQLLEMFTKHYFDNPKPIELLRHIIDVCTKTPNSQLSTNNSPDIILDFFSGSATTAHAVMQLNAEDKGNRKFIMVQLPEITDEKSEAYKAGYKNICEIGKERIRRAGKKIVESLEGRVARETANSNKENKTDEKLSRFESLANGDGFGTGDLFTDKETSKGRNICSNKSNEASIGFNSIEYSGGASTQLNEGISSVSSDSKGINSRTGNTTLTLCENKLFNTSGDTKSNEFVRGNKQNALGSEKISTNSPLATHHSLDIGFRVLKCDTTNMKDVYYNPKDTDVEMFDNQVSNIKEDRTPQDLLFQVMLDLGILLSSKITETEIASKKVFSINDNLLIACFDDNITDEVVTEIAKKKPYYFVMRDSGYADDSVATNLEQIFKTYSPDTERKVL